MKIAFSTIEGQKFEATAYWKGGQFNRVYDVTDATSGKRPCQVSRELIRAILLHRGI